MVVVDIAGRPGLWIRAGQQGAVAGIDWSAFLALIPAGVDRDKVLSLARSYEAGLIEGCLELMKKP